MARPVRAAAPPADPRIGDMLRQVRERQGLSLRTLATRAGFSASFLSQLENGQVSPSIASLARIASQLGVTLADLFEATEDRPAIVVRADARPGFTSSWSRARIESLVPASRRRPFEALCVTLAPQGSSGRTPEAHAADQFAYVLSGAPTLDVGDERFRLRAGDAVVLHKGHPYRWSNEGSGAAEVLFVASRFDL